MKLQEIRTRTAYDPNALPTQKAATRTWLSGMSKELPLGLTLTLKQTIIGWNTTQDERLIMVSIIFKLPFLILMEQ
jgi:hypothetical protein